MSRAGDDVWQIFTEVAKLRHPYDWERDEQGRWWLLHHKQRDKRPRPWTPREAGDGMIAAMLLHALNSPGAQFDFGPFAPAKKTKRGREAIDTALRVAAFNLFLRVRAPVGAPRD